MSENVHASSFPALRNALALLRGFTSGDERVGVTELAERTGLHKSSVSRLLVALEEEGLVARDEETRRYRLALGLVELAGPFLGSLDIRRATRPLLAQLRDLSGENVALVQWSGTDAVVVEQETGVHEIAHNTPVGTRYRTVRSSSVQVFLAQEPPERIRPLLTDLPDPDAYLCELDAGREQGVFRNVRGTAPDAVGLAAPVRDHRGDVVAAVLLAAPAFRTDGDVLEVRAAQVRQTSRAASTVLGHP